MLKGLVSKHLMPMLSEFVEDDPIALGIDMVMRQRRWKWDVHIGATPGIPIIGNSDEFTAFVQASVIKAIFNRWKSPSFYLLVHNVDRAKDWPAMRALGVGLGMHGARPLITAGRDLYVITNDDYFLCEIHAVIDGVANG